MEGENATETAQDALKRLTYEGAHARYGASIPEKVHLQIANAQDGFLRDRPRLRLSIIFCRCKSPKLHSPSGDYLLLGLSDFSTANEAASLRRKEHGAGGRARKAR